MLSTLFRISSVFLFCTSVMANDIYITQSGDSLDLDIVQDGQNNQIEGLSGSGNAIIYGANSDVSFNQTGDSNQIRVWSDSSSNKNIQGMAGISFVIANKNSLESIRNNDRKNYYCPLILNQPSQHFLALSTHRSLFYMLCV